MGRIFDQLLGHKSTIHKLNIIISENRWPSGLIFLGPSGVGKYLVAKAFAQKFLCNNSTPSHESQASISQSNSPCGDCGPCLRVENEQNENLVIVKPDGLQIKIDQIRTLIKQLSLKPQGQGRFVLINDAQTMTSQASNALLKSLEEPPQNTFFILLAPSLSGLLPTIKSRSQIIRFGPLSDNEISQLSQLPQWIQKSARGRLDRLQHFEPEFLSQLRTECFQSMEYFLAGTAQKSFDQIKARFNDKTEALSVVHIWQQLLRDARLYSHLPNYIVHDEFMELLGRLANLGEVRLHNIYQKVLGLESDIGRNLDRSLAVECFLRSGPNL